METPPAEELLKKIQELEVGHARLKQEMSKLTNSGSEDVKSDQSNQRSHSVSPRRNRLPAYRRRGGGAGGLEGSAWARRSTSFRYSSPLQRENRNRDPSNVGGSGSEDSGPSAVKFTDKQYSNNLQSMGQSVYIFDTNGRIFYWCVVQLV